MKATKFAMAAALVMAAFAATAAPVTVDLTTYNPYQSLKGGNGNGNERKFTTASGVTVTATAWSLTGWNLWEWWKPSTLQTAKLGQYDTGLGVCNRNESRHCDAPEHQVSNNDSLDFVLFQFSAAVDPTTVRIDPFNKQDRDVSYWTGNIADAQSIDGKTLGQLVSALNLNPRIDQNYSESKHYLDVNITSGLVNSLLFGASALPTDRNDLFKITSISFDYTKPTPPVEVPEPGSLALIALALGGLGLARRRRAV